MREGCSAVVCERRRRRIWRATRQSAIDMAQIIFVPMARDDALALRSGTGPHRYSACAATSGLAASMEADTVIDEVEYAALSNAGVLALVLKPNTPRLVLAATRAGGRRGPAGRGRTAPRGEPAAPCRRLYGHALAGELRAAGPARGARAVIGKAANPIG